MRIGINGRFLVAKQTGVQRAAYNLIKALVTVDRHNEYFLFTSEEQLKNPDWDYPNITVVPSRIRRGEDAFNVFVNHIWEQIRLPALARKHKVDILHSPANLAPLFYRGKSIVHIHDLCVVINPQWFSWSFRTVYNFIIPRLAKRADKVVTNSNNSRNDLLQFCRVPAHRVSQTYWAVDDLFIQEGHSAKDGSKPTGSAGEGLDYILYVGSLEPRKNITMLLEAYERLRAAHPDIHTKLILIGGERTIFAEVRLRVKRYEDDILFKGFVEDRELRDYFRNARLLVYPSLYEGFGLPPLEAMASGVPVVTTRTSSIPEVVGDAALMVSPYDVRQLADAMAKVLSDDALRRSMIKRGLKQVTKFNWFRVARSTLAVYYEVYNSSRTRDSYQREFLPIELWRELKEVEKSHLKELVGV